MRSTSLAALAFSLSLLLPAVASAHQHETFRIGGKTYVFTVGSLNEPVIVDDKSGVELEVALQPAAHDNNAAHADGSAEHDEGTPVLGLEKTLQVELSAAGKTKTLPITTQYGKPGAYKAVFIPTVATTLTYRVFGTIDGSAVDLSFSCNPAGHPATPEDNTETKLSDTVTRVGKSGSFGCPQVKADLGFPEPAPSLADLGTDGGAGGDPFQLPVFGLSVAAIALATAALVKAKK